jgi:hypothetical protein
MKDDNVVDYLVVGMVLVAFFVAFLVAFTAT